jgi:hypothetical protein
MHMSLVQARMHAAHMQVYRGRFTKARFTKALVHMPAPGVTAVVQQQHSMLHVPKGPHLGHHAKWHLRGLV